MIRGADERLALLIPAIHAGTLRKCCKARALPVDARDKRGHDASLIGNLRGGRECASVMTASTKQRVASRKEGRDRSRPCLEGQRGGYATDFTVVSSLTLRR